MIGIQILLLFTAGLAGFNIPGNAIEPAVNLVQLAAKKGTVLEGPARIIDGDTLQINRVRVRLNGLAAPEMDENGGYKSRLALINLTKGKKVKCVLNGDRSYNRLIGVCYVNGRDVAIDMVQTGNARDCPRYSGGRYTRYETSLSRSLPFPKYCR